MLMSFCFLFFVVLFFIGCEFVLILVRVIFFFFIIIILLPIRIVVGLVFFSFFIDLLLLGFCSNYMARSSVLSLTIFSSSLIRTIIINDCSGCVSNPPEIIQWLAKLSCTVLLSSSSGLDHCPDADSRSNSSLRLFYGFGNFLFCFFFQLYLLVEELGFLLLDGHRNYWGDLPF
jgi:hypothetical protein